jgi:oligopeptide transport system ATP-binding protein
MALLQLRDLHVSFPGAQGRVLAVNGLGFELYPGRALGLVGESGSGKSQVALAIMGLLAPQAQCTGSIRFEADELVGLPATRMNRLRGSRIGMVFQDPTTSLNPYLTIGEQMTEVLRAHRGATQAQALAEARRLLDLVRIPDAAARLAAYPHEFSGGMCQRVAIAMSVICKPKLLIADEPTTALDPTVQLQVLALLDELRRELSLAILLITHDLGVVAELCDRVLVMYAGREMESGDAASLLTRPTHPYTRGLLACRPRLDDVVDRPLPAIPGAPPPPGHAVSGCVFAPRCGDALDACRALQPAPVEYGHDIRRACLRHPTALR